MRNINDYKGFKDKCYNVNTPRKRWGKATEKYDDVLKKWIKVEDYQKLEGKDIDFPKVSGWNEEWTYLSTGMRMSKRQLKEYCKKNGKIWDNG